jgi:hypothetical protein
MKNYLLILVCSFSLFIISCSGSDSYQGNWKATDEDGNKFEIHFEPKRFTIKDSTQKVVEFNYTQNSVQIANGLKTYGIELSDGRQYSIRFPIVGDDNKAIIVPENEKPAYTICRTDYITYDDLYKLTSH